jgi:hypothetical protein
VIAVHTPDLVFGNATKRRVLPGLMAAQITQI